jgi:hypothetical protein
VRPGPRAHPPPVLGQEGREPVEDQRPVPRARQGPAGALSPARSKHRPAPRQTAPVRLALAPEGRARRCPRPPARSRAPRRTASPSRCAPGRRPPPAPAARERSGGDRAPGDRPAKPDAVDLRLLHRLAGRLLHSDAGASRKAWMTLCRSSFAGATSPPAMRLPSGEKQEWWGWTLVRHPTETRARQELHAKETRAGLLDAEQR